MQLVQYAPMRTAVLKAASQALRSERAIVIFECSQGRHRSVGAAGILYQILQPLIPKMKLIHASSKNWQGTCGGECPECRSGPPPAFHQEIDGLRNELLAQMLRDYMEPPALAIAIDKQHEPPRSCPACQVGDFGCQAFQHLLDGLQVCLPCCNEITPLNEYKIPFATGYFKYFSLEMSNKNHFQQKSTQTSKNRFENRQAQLGRELLPCFRQSLWQPYPVVQELDASLCHKPPYQPRSVAMIDPDKSLLGTSSHGSELLMTALGTFKGVCFFNGALQGGMDYEQLLDQDLFQLIPPLPEPNPVTTFEDFLIFENLQEYDSYALITNLQSQNTDESRDHLILTEEPCSSPSWIGAQPDLDSDGESRPDHQGTISPRADNGSCAPTEIDTFSNCSSTTQPFYCPSPHSRGRKRKLHENIILTEEPCSSPSWIGAQPDLDSDGESRPDHQGTISPRADNASCAPTEIDTFSNGSSTTQPFYCPSPHSRGRKRKLHENINSMQQSEVNSQTQEQKEIDAALAFENCSPSYCDSHTQSRADSIQNFLVQYGPYPGWEFDEYPQTFDYSPTQDVCSGSTGSSCSSCGPDADTQSRSGVISPQRHHTPSDEGFWDHWILDSDGNF